MKIAFKCAFARGVCVGWHLMNIKSMNIVSANWINIEWHFNAQCLQNKYSSLLTVVSPFPAWRTRMYRCFIVDPGFMCSLHQKNTPNGYFGFHINHWWCVDGISLTHGEPRQHVWSFVAALDETGTHLSACRCSNLHDIDNGATVPPSLPCFHKGYVKAVWVAPYEYYSGHEVVNIRHLSSIYSQAA